MNQGHYDAVDSLEVGQSLGSLTVVDLKPGAKNRHPTAICRCTCGGSRVVRQSRLRRGVIKPYCTTCAKGTTWDNRRRSTDREKRKTYQLHAYKGNARSKGVNFALSKEQVSILLDSQCYYCGCSPADGMDRVDNRGGYTAKNTVPCCSFCNYAKRESTVSEFLDWVRRVYEYSC